MLIDRIDVYWAKFRWPSCGRPRTPTSPSPTPSSCAWKAAATTRGARAARPTSRATPPSTPSAPSTPCASTWRPRIDRPGHRDRAGHPGPARLHEGQPVRAGRARHHLVGARRQAPRAAAAPRPGRHRRPRGGGGRLRDPGLARSPHGEGPGGGRRGLSAGEAQVPPGMGSLHGGGGTRDLPGPDHPHRLQRGLLSGRHPALPLARPLQARHDRAAAGRRRHEPGQPRGPAAADRDAGLPGRERPEPGPRGGGHRARALPGGQHQDGPRGRAHRVRA